MRIIFTDTVYTILNNLHGETYNVMEVEVHAVQHILNDGIIPCSTAFREPQLPDVLTQRWPKPLIL